MVHEIDEEAKVAFMDMVEDMDDCAEKDAHWAKYNELVEGGYKVVLVEGGANEAQKAYNDYQAKKAKKAKSRKRKKQSGDNKLTYFEIATDLKPEYFDWEPSELAAVGDTAAMLEVMLARLDAVGGCEVSDAYGITHDRDYRPKWDEVKGDYILEQKLLHDHFIFKFAGKGAGLTIANAAKALGIAENMIDKPGRGQRWDNALAYLIHAKDADKAQYEPSEVVTARGEDYMEIWRLNKEKWERGRAVKSHKTAKAHESIDWVEDEILHGRITRQQVLLDDDMFEVYSRNFSRLDKAFLVYEERVAAIALKKFEDNEYVPSVFFVYGADGGEGKSTAIIALVKWLQDHYGWRVDEPSSGHIGDHLTGAEILLMDDCDAAAMTATDWLGLFDEKRGIKPTARYKDKQKQKARVIIIISNERPLEFFAHLQVIQGADKSGIMNKFFRRLQTYIRVVHPNDYGYHNWFLQEAKWGDEYKEKLNGTWYKLRYKFENIEDDMVYSPYGAMLFMAHHIDKQNGGILTSRDDVDDVFKALVDYIYDAYHPAGTENLRHLPPLPTRDELSDKTSWKQVKKMREREAYIEEMEKKIEDYLAYQDWLDEFHLLEAAEKAGLATVPKSWRRSYRCAPKPAIDWFCDENKKPEEDGDWPLTFEEWKRGYWEGYETK